MIPFSVCVWATVPVCKFVCEKQNICFFIPVPLQPISNQSTIYNDPFKKLTENGKFKNMLNTVMGLQQLIH